MLSLWSISSVVFGVLYGDAPVAAADAPAAAGAARRRSRLLTLLLAIPVALLGLGARAAGGRHADHAAVHRALGGDRAGRARRARPPRRSAG